MSFHDEVDAAILRTSARIADPIREAIRASIDPGKIIDAFLQDFPPGSEVTPQQARDWAQIHIVPNNSKLVDALSRVYATGWQFGQDYAVTTIARAKLQKSPDPSIVVDWSKWKPGDSTAALLVRPKGGLARLLGRRNITINGISNTTLNRIGTVLARGIEEGATARSIAYDLMEEGIRDIADDPIRAMTIANTEMARAVSVATVDGYKEYGVEKMEWLSLDPCDACEGNSEAGPIAVGEEFPSGDTEPPAHPNCRCTVLPVIPGLEDDEGIDYEDKAAKLDKFDENQPRDEHGRFSSDGDSGGSTETSGNTKDYTDLHSTASKYPDDIRDKMREANQREYETSKLDENDPERIAALAQYREAYGQSKTDYLKNDEGFFVRNDDGSLVIVETVIQPSLDGQWRRDTFETVDSEGKPTDPATRGNGTDEEQHKLRDEYVVKDPQTLAMNRGLNAGRDSTKADRIDKWVNGSTLKTDLVLYRGAAMPQKVADQLQPGASINIGGYQSHAYGEKEAEFYLNTRMNANPDAVPVMFENVVTAGTHAVDASYGEVVVQRGTTLEVVDREMRDGTLYVKGVIRGQE